MQFLDDAANKLQDTWNKLQDYYRPLGSDPVSTKAIVSGGQTQPVPTAETGSMAEQYKRSLASVAKPAPMPVTMVDKPVAAMPDKMPTEMPMDIPKSMPAYVPSNEHTDKPVSGQMTHYDPMSARQTKKNPDGVGALSRKVEFGDIAVGDRALLQKAKVENKKGNDLMVYIDSMKDVDVGNGPGIFRVNDGMNKRFDGKGKIDFALPATDQRFDQFSKRIGNGMVDYVILPPKSRTK